MYDLLDKEWKIYYVMLHKWMFIGSACLVIILIILDRFYIKGLILLAAVFLFCALAFYFTWNKHKVKYGKKLSYTEDTITIYDYKNAKIKEFQIKDLKSKSIEVLFDFNRDYWNQKCLILYTDMEPYDQMEYNLYWTYTNMVIIQNSKVIDIVNKLLNTN